MAELLDEQALTVEEASGATVPHDSELPALKRADGNFVTTLTLNNRTCKWPIGDPTDRNFHYCGRRPESGRPYCDAHELRSYQPLRSRSNQRSSLPRSR